MGEECTITHVDVLVSLPVLSRFLRGARGDSSSVINHLRVQRQHRLPPYQHTPTTSLTEVRVLTSISPTTETMMKAALSRSAHSLQWHPSGETPLINRGLCSFLDK